MEKLMQLRPHFLKTKHSVIREKSNIGIFYCHSPYIYSCWSNTKTDLKQKIAVRESQGRYYRVKKIDSHSVAGHKISSFLPDKCCLNDGGMNIDSQ
ncbi:hypothetical protein CDAR_34981 [Caerostris darwini]|uniref:Uncharacterized protein n=1 Tax=Caerostris darwini TaxID=1538125 RepID=A0AAV4MTP9_9ARAC|nr:hypothetical protein CDAR_34981 [Caerostris darwini]